MSLRLVAVWTPFAWPSSAASRPSLETMRWEWPASAAVSPEGLTMRGAVSVFFFLCRPSMEPMRRPSSTSCKTHDRGWGG